MKISKTSPLMVRPLTGPVDLSRSPHRRAARTLVLCTLAAIAIAIAIGAALAVKHRRADSPLLSREFVRQHEEFSGTVEQALAAGSYTYFALRTPSGQLRWVVTMSRAHRDAKWLYVESFGSREGFASAKLQRRFELLYFVSVRKHSG
jgi:hypothetical protein